MDLSRDAILASFTQVGYIADPQLATALSLMHRLKRQLGVLPESERFVQAHGLTRADLGLEHDETIDVSEGPAETDIASALGYCLQPNPPLNLLTGPFAASMAAPPWRKMRSVMIAAGVLLAVLLAQFSLEWLTLARERDRLLVGIESVFQSSLPNSRMVQPVTQFRQVLEGNAPGTAAGGGALLHEALAVVSQAGTAEIRQFRATPAELEIELQLPSFAELEALRAGLAAKPRLQEALQGADSGSEGVTARLKVTRRES